MTLNTKAGPAHTSTGFLPFEYLPWEVNQEIHVMSACEISADVLNRSVPDRVDYYLWCMADLTLSPPPDKFKGVMESYSIFVNPTIEGSFRHPDSKIASSASWVNITKECSPQTQQGHHSYTHSSETSLSASAGFFGFTLQASVTGTYSVGNSDTVDCPDVDIVASHRNDQTSWLFKLTSPLEDAALASVTLSVIAVFLVKGFNPMYLAYLDYVNGPQPPRATVWQDPTSPSTDPNTNFDIDPLTPDDFADWNKATPEGKFVRLQTRAEDIESAIKFGCVVNFRANTTIPGPLGQLPLNPTVIPIGTPLFSAGGQKNAWLKFMKSNPHPATRAISPGVGRCSVIVGQLICGDSNYKSRDEDKNSYIMYDYQFLRSYNMEYTLRIAKIKETNDVQLWITDEGNRGISDLPSQVVWGMKRSLMPLPAPIVDLPLALVLTPHVMYIEVVGRGSGVAALDSWANKEIVRGETDYRRLELTDHMPGILRVSTGSNGILWKQLDLGEDDGWR
jgi:hypothetical protein